MLRQRTWTLSIIVNSPNNAGFTPGPGISLAILNNSFSALTAVSFATEWLVAVVSEADGRGIGVGAATDSEAPRLYVVSDAVSVVERFPTSLRRVGVGIGVEGHCWTRLGFDKEGFDPGGLFFPNFLNIEDIFGDTVNLGMMVQNTFEV